MDRPNTLDQPPLDFSRINPIPSNIPSRCVVRLRNELIILNFNFNTMNETACIFFFLVG